jgi:uncharacterized membrane protein YfcA
VIASLAGLLTGLAAGFVGVGGGEFRIPILVRVLRFPIPQAAGINLVVGLFTVTLGVFRRWGQHPFGGDAVVLLGVMALASAAGATLGVLGRRRLPVRLLGLAVRAYLVVVGLWMLYEAIAHVEHVLVDPSGAARWVLAAAVAFAIAVVSGVMGVAGGEMRIPALLYLFGVPIVEAGTLSLLVSIPTVAAGALTDRRLGGIPNAVLRVTLVLALASLAGVWLGAMLLPYANRELIKGTLGVVLLLASVRLPTDVGGPPPAAGAGRM